MITDEMPTFYERSLTSSFCSYFFFIGFLLLLFVRVAPHVALHRVSIRTLLSFLPLKLGAGWGSVGESMLPFIRRPRSAPKSARSHRNTGVSRHVSMLPPYA